MFIKRHGVFH